MKKTLIIFGSLLALVVIGAFVASFFLGAIVTKGVNDFAPGITGTKVTLDSASILEEFRKLAATDGAVAAQAGDLPAAKGTKTIDYRPAWEEEQSEE